MVPAKSGAPLMRALQAAANSAVKAKRAVAHPLTGDHSYSVTWLRRLGLSRPALKPDAAAALAVTPRPGRAA